MVEDIKVVLDKIEKLPELFHVAVRVAKMLDDLNIDVNQLSRIISLDQALTTQLLKLCNSAQYGFSRKIVTVKDAVAKLGFKTIKSLVFVAISHGILNSAVKGYDLGKGELWKNSISCAVYSRYLAKMSNYKDPETAFTAGLLRDIGKLMIHEYVGINYSNILNTINSEGISFSNAEEQVLGFNHCQIGSAVANKWNFPPILVDTIKYHHNYDAAINEGCEDIKLLSIVHIADSITMMLGNGMGNDGMMYNINLKSLNYLDISQQSASIENLISEMVELKTEIDEMIGIVNGE
ncbi:MAG: HDOD domain-containing protein [Candidatus Gastranaerophilales bacterium]|nr:HDOD domain-containing protein [Candidatus Gastranaerophilales bacterium]